MIKSFVRILPAIFWMLLLYYFSDNPTTGVPLYGTSRFFFFKTIHFFSYFILGYLLQYGLHKKKSLSLAYGIFYALLDETHQGQTPGRTPRLGDVYLDSFSLLVAVFSYQTFPKILKKFILNL